MHTIGVLAYKVDRLSKSYPVACTHINGVIGLTVNEEINHFCKALTHTLIGKSGIACKHRGRKSVSGKSRGKRFDICLNTLNSKGKRFLKAGLTTHGNNFDVGSVTGREYRGNIKAHGFALSNAGLCSELFILTFGGKFVIYGQITESRCLLTAVIFVKANRQSRLCRRSNGKAQRAAAVHQADRVSRATTAATAGSKRNTVHATLTLVGRINITAFSVLFQTEIVFVD